ncbi:MAG TPA: NADH-quinone oxidoreductase subunit M [Chthoniobacterales bacterium]|nr:NADH-quinone oxidoreductase subunit M [Chthoniobacterales bacterium]
MITALVVIPLIGALFVSVAPQSRARAVALGLSLLTALVALTMWRNFDGSSAELQFVERYTWIPAIGAEYLLGVDGFSLLLVLLTSIVVPFALLAQPAGRGFCALMLITQTALYGTFTAQNFVLWFLFFEMSLIPSFLLIKLWGGLNRDRAAVKFFVFTFFGSVAMLLAFLGIYLAHGTFDFARLAGLGAARLLTGNVGWLAFGGIFLGLAVKAALFPFHTWLPDTYENAPTGATMVLSGLLSKMGIYGFIRLLLPLFPHEISTIAPWLLTLAVCSILLSALAAWAQSDLKRMVAYLSITHLGYCMLGIFAVAALPQRPPVEAQATLSGVMMQVFNHGITAAALFYFVGLLEQRRGSRTIADFGGLMQRTPLLCGWMSVALFSFLGLPGLNGFIGEFLIFKGSFALAASATAVAVFGLLFTAVALLRCMQALFSGRIANDAASFADLRRNELTVVVPVSLLMLAIGIAPQWVFNIFNATVIQMARALA